MSRYLPEAPLSALLRALPDVRAASHEELHDEYALVGQDLEADRRALAALVAGVRPPGARAIVALGRHAEAMALAGGLVVGGAEVCVAHDEVELRAALRSHMHSDAIAVALRAPDDPTVEGLLRLAARERPALPRLEVHVPGPLLFHYSIDIKSFDTNSSSGGDGGRVTPMVLMVGALPARIEHLLRERLPGTFGVHIMRPGGTLPLSPDQYRIIVVLSPDPRVARRLSRAAPSAILVAPHTVGRSAVAEPAQVLSKPWALEALGGLVEGLAASMCA